MRTTLKIEDDLAGLLKRHATESGVSFKEAVNRAIRAGLGTAPSKARREPVVKTVSHSFGFKVGIDLIKLGKLSDELEANAFVVSLDKVNDSSRRKRPRSRS